MFASRMYAIKILMLTPIMITPISASNSFKQITVNKRTVFDPADSFVAHGSLDCGMTCAHAQNCRSFFYNTRTGMCQIHNHKFDLFELTLGEEETEYYQRELPEETVTPGLLMVPFLDEKRRGSSIMRNKTITDFHLPETSNVLFLGFMKRHKRIIVAKLKPAQFDVFDMTGVKMTTVKNVTFHALAVDENKSKLFFSPVSPEGHIGVMTSDFQNITLNHVFKGQFTPRGLAVDPEAEVLFVVLVKGDSSRIVSIPYAFTNLTLIKETEKSYVIAIDPTRKDIYYSLKTTFMKNASSFMTDVKRVASGSSIAFRYPKILYVSGSGENYIRVVDTTMKETEMVDLPFNVSTSMAICFIE